MRIETTIDLDTDFGSLEDVPAVFDVEVETYPAEPYSWGGSRGTERSVTARLISIRLGELTLNDNEVTAWLGREPLHYLETFIEETF